MSDRWLDNRYHYMMQMLALQLYYRPHAFCGLSDYSFNRELQFKNAAKLAYIFYEEFLDEPVDVHWPSTSGTVGQLAVIRQRCHAVCVQVGREETAAQLLRFRLTLNLLLDLTWKQTEEIS